MDDLFFGRHDGLTVVASRSPEALRVALVGHISDDEDEFGGAGPINAFLGLNNARGYAKVIIDISRLSDIGSGGIRAIRKLMTLGRSYEFASCLSTSSRKLAAEIEALNTEEVSTAAAADHCIYA